MKDKIYLDAIIDDKCGQPFMEEEGSMVALAEDVRDALREAIRQALVLASEKARVKWYPGDGTLQGVDKQSILDIEKLIV
jgi:hypothetical protein